MVSPAPSSSRNWSQVAHSGTSSELASSTRGAKLWVRNTPTGLPDWPSRVSSPPRRPAGGEAVGPEPPPRLARRDQQGLVVAEPAQGGHDPVEGRPVPRRPAGAAVDHQVVGPLGDLRVEVVAQHPQGRFLLPAPAGELRPPRGAHD